jgi:hypothetical protein
MSTLVYSARPNRRRVTAEGWTSSMDQLRPYHHQNRYGDTQVTTADEDECERELIVDSMPHTD